MIPQTTPKGPQNVQVALCKLQQKAKDSHHEHVLPEMLCINVRDYRCNRAVPDPVWSRRVRHSARTYGVKHEYASGRTHEGGERQLVVLWVLFLEHRPIFSGLALMGEVYEEAIHASHACCSYPPAGTGRRRSSANSAKNYTFTRGPAYNCTRSSNGTISTTLVYS